MNITVSTIGFQQDMEDENHQMLTYAQEFKPICIHV